MQLWLAQYWWRLRSPGELLPVFLDLPWRRAGLESCRLRLCCYRRSSRSAVAVLDSVEWLSGLHTLCRCCFGKWSVTSHTTTGFDRELVKEEEDEAE